ncbi:MBL fold metallo-hydrolase [Rhizobium sp. NFR03]|uniref:MBL fold metallo-hydrolase n=1 Tax=Rhizobium sp. NFR03 TaxID=1566263 RepID=UPI0008AE14AE|nr:MBL fold metallo-hydrolase [Rhizobium sp. NFR03]SES33515.1 L-ascorbate metabolism protein UlaG, beta-lactamase superfamily [Rhizobium sp. NFR03]
MLRSAVLTCAVLASAGVAFLQTPSFAQERAVSQCQAIARALPGSGFVQLASADPSYARQAAARDQTVAITFLGHSTFLLETPEGVTIATDYSGFHRPPQPPMVATMNKAHSTHYTLTPGPGIAHVLHGWGDNGNAADHDLLVGDAYIRNVPTDIRAGYGGAMEPDGNSIFIFEVAGLCIGHLGHLHHELDETDYAEIGRLDVVMVPVDGGLTMGAEGMVRVVTRLRSSLILPMHRRGPPVESFLGLFGPGFDRTAADSATVNVSLRTLPKKPLIMVLQGL